MTGIFDAVDGVIDPILVVCYSGQSAAYAHMLLRLAGYEAYSLKWGMSIYDASLDVWTSKCSNSYANDEDWVTTASVALPAFDPPVLNTGKTTGAEILQARLTAAAAMWSGTTISAADVMADPSAYNIMCYWGAGDYTTLGHIDGAYQLTPKTLKSTQNLYVFDPDADNILYCWTGQTAAATIAYLKVLGYENVSSISFGVNSMIYAQLSTNKWPKPW
ncbi:MAG: rhodanese-like domain-containing protein [Calditrichaeota bacterium]|nr:MAG: rhodanese-like domain-containing protein [Calditrichota bacterium]